MPTADPFGHALLAQRLAQIPGELSAMLARELPALGTATLATKRFIVTGTGSSEAHARYLCHLVNLHTDRGATFLPLSAFAAPAPQLAWRDRTLVVFSQGLSPNARLALGRHREFAHTVLFTATPRQTSQPENARLIGELLDAGAECIPFPIADEHSTLVRCVGPMCGYLAALQFAARLPGATLPRPRAEQVLALLDSAPPASLVEACRAKRFAHGFGIIASAPISLFAQNLSCKFMEGLFWRSPVVSDFLEFAHGPFQQATASQLPALILQNNTASDAEFVRRTVEMLQCAGIEAHVLRVAADPLLAIFGFEAAINRLVFDLVRYLDVDQINWPGKGCDAQLYQFASVQ